MHCAATSFGGSRVDRMNDPAKAGLRGRALLSWSGSRARQHRVEPGESSVSANHAPAARSRSSSCPSTRGDACSGRSIRRPCGGDDHLTDPEFEKEAWLSMVMLEWGSCGQIAVHCPDSPTAGEDEAPPVQSGDAPCLGYAFYAPPGAVPRARRFPTGPVSPDAVLLTSIGVESGRWHRRLLRHSLIAAVVGDLVRRGVRALEAFGRTAEVAELLDPRTVPSDLRPAVEVLGDCSVDQCIVDADFLQEVGFVVVAPHPVLPAAAARAGSRAGLEGRCRGGAGAAAAERAAAAARRRGCEHLLDTCLARADAAGLRRRTARGRAVRRK